MAGRQGLKAMLHQTITLPPPRLTVMMTMHTFCLISLQIISQKVLGTSKMFLAFTLELSHRCHFCPVSLLPVTEANEACSCCSGFYNDFLDESLWSWSNFGGKVPSFLHSWIMALTVVLQSPKALKWLCNRIQLMNVNYFVSHLSLNVCKSWHDVFVFEIF